MLRWNSSILNGWFVSCDDFKPILNSSVAQLYTENIFVGLGPDLVQVYLLSLTTCISGGRGSQLKPDAKAKLPKNDRRLFFQSGLHGPDPGVSPERPREFPARADSSAARKMGPCHQVSSFFLFSKGLKCLIKRATSACSR